MKQLTEFGEFIKNFVIVAMKELQEVMGLVVGLVRSFGDQSEGAAAMLHLFTVPIKILLKLLTKLGPEMLTTLMIYSKLNQILPTNTMMMANNINMKMIDIEMSGKNIAMLMGAGSPGWSTTLGTSSCTLFGGTGFSSFAKGFSSYLFFSNRGGISASNSVAQAAMGVVNNNRGSGGQTSTALMVLLLSAALFLIPGMREQYGKIKFFLSNLIKN